MIKNKMFFSIILFFVSFYLFSGIMGAVKGTVKEKESKTPIEGVKVKIENLKVKNINYTVETNSKGEFYKSGLQPGLYSLVYEKEGFVPVRKVVRVGINETINETIFLEKVSLSSETESKLKKAIDVFNKGKYKEAVKFFKSLLEEDSKNPILYFYIGFSYKKIGNIDSAIENFKKSIEIKPDFSFSLKELGTIYAKKGDFKKAMEFYKKAIDAGGGDADTLYNYGVCAINLGENSVAKLAMEKVIKIDPNYSDAYYQLGLIYLGVGDMKKAKEMLERFIELEPESNNSQTAKEILKSLK